MLHFPFWKAFCLKSAQPHLPHGGTAEATTALGAADVPIAVGFSEIGDVLADVIVVAVVVVVVAAPGTAGVSAASALFLASLAIRSELSPPPAPGSLNPPMPPIRLPTVDAGAVASAGVPSTLGCALASGTAAAK